MPSGAVNLSGRTLCEDFVHDVECSAEGAIADRFVIFHLSRNVRPRIGKGMYRAGVADQLKACACGSHFKTELRDLLRSDKRIAGAVKDQDLAFDVSAGGRPLSIQRSVDTDGCP